MKLSAFTAVRNAIRRGCPLLEVAAAGIPFVDEWWWQDGFSTDGTWELLLEMSRVNPKIKLFQSKWNSFSPNGEAIGEAYEEARKRCQMELCVMIQADTVFEADGLAKVSAAFTENPSLRSLAFLIVTMKSWTEIFDMSCWKGYRCWAGKMEFNPFVVADAASLQCYQPMTKRSDIVLVNLGYLFPGNSADKLSQSEAIFTFTSKKSVLSDELDPVALLRDPSRITSIPYDPIQLPSFVRDLSGMSRYTVRRDIMDILRPA